MVCTEYYQKKEFRNSSKVIQTLFLIFFCVSFYRENELSKAQSYKNFKVLLCNAPKPSRKPQFSKPK